MASWGKTRQIVLLLALVGVTRGTAGEISLPWEQAWERALQTTSCSSRIELLRRAIAAGPRPALEVPAPGTSVIRGFFPHLRLAEALYDCRHYDEAEKVLADLGKREWKVEAELRDLARERRLSAKQRVFVALGEQRAEDIARLRSELAARQRQVAEVPPPATPPRDTKPPPWRPPPPPSRQEPTREPEREPQSVPATPEGRPASPGAGGSPATGRPGSVGDAPTRKPVTPIPTSPRPVEPPSLGDRSGEEATPPPATVPAPTPEPPAPVPTAEPLLPAGTRPRLEIGTRLRLGCGGSCRYDTARGLVTIAGERVRLARGYEEIEIDGQVLPVPRSTPGATSYDDDLDAMEALLELKADGRLIVEVPQGADLSVPTPWLVGVGLYWHPGKPSHLYEACGRGFEQILGLKTIRHRERVNHHLRACADYRPSAPAAD